VFYCEKEGFSPLWKAVDLVNRYDLFNMSNKGLSVTAARKLIDTICGEYGIHPFTLHDFDFDGLKNAATLCRDSRRYEFANKIRPVNLGLRLADIREIEEEDDCEPAREPAAPSKMSEPGRRRLLREYGATDEEVEFLLNERIELNAAKLGVSNERFVLYQGGKAVDAAEDEEIEAEATLAAKASARARSW
jgi:hypothetical protein